jgi:mannose-6-phosphate isomerase-like protein (cupin superfamily)
MTPPTHGATISVSGHPFDETLAFFSDELGFRLDRISPADKPTLAVLSRGGVSVCLDPKITSLPSTLRIESGAAPAITAPNGITVEFVDPPMETVVVPDLVPELVVSLAGDESNWITGRAGMRYRDLIPSRLGGRFIASHIEVCDGGPVPDLVHHHAIRFQMIFCHRGWVDVVYEDQGKPFRLEAGDCVLQPPHIRHRVLESSAGAQVVEIGCPAEHDTFFDYGLELPTSTVDLNRDFSGQTFVRHQSSEVAWGPSVHPGFEVQHTAIQQATKGLASVRVLRSSNETTTPPTYHEGEFWFLFVLEGSTGFAVNGSISAAPLSAGDSVVVPASLTWRLSDASPDLKLLEVVVP